MEYYIKHSKHELFGIGVRHRVNSLMISQACGPIYTELEAKYHEANYNSMLCHNDQEKQLDASIYDLEEKWSRGREKREPRDKSFYYKHTISIIRCHQSKTSVKIFFCPFYLIFL